jgi:MFS family permease
MSAPRDLRLLAGAVFLSALGDFVALIALVLRVHELTGSGFAVAALFATTMVPVVALAPVAGLLADRVESVRLLAGVSLLQAAVAAALAFSGSLPAILVLSLVLGAGAAISQPAEFALVPAVAGRSGLTRANGIMETARYAGFTAGPLLGGVLTAGGGSRLALLVNAASFVAIAIGALLMRARRRPEAREGTADRARDGFAFLWGDRTLRVLVTAAVSALVLISASMTAEVFYVVDVIGAGDAGFAFVIACWTIGMVAGATGLAHRLGGSGKATTALLALAAQGAGMALGASWAALPVAMAGFFAGGLGHGVKNVLIRTVIGERTPKQLHGRAFAAYNGLRNTAELGALALGGVMVATIGAQAALVLAGLGPVVAGLAGVALLQRRGAPVVKILRPERAHR